MNSDRYLDYGWVYGVLGFRAVLLSRDHLTNRLKSVPFSNFPPKEFSSGHITGETQGESCHHFSNPPRSRFRAGMLSIDVFCSPGFGQQKVYTNWFWGSRNLIKCDEMSQWIYIYIYIIYIYDIYLHIYKTRVIITIFGVVI